MAFMVRNTACMEVQLTFYKFIIGEVNEFIYCEGAKIWDCFTGLRLVHLTNCKIKKKKKLAN